MAAKPNSIDIRAYNVGFGDCFLLTFNYPDRKKHVLIDFGTTQPPGTMKAARYMLGIAKKIKAVCGGHLDAIVETHRHADHISGFATGKKTEASGDVIRACTDDATLFVHPWTEDPDAATDSTGPPQSSQTPKAFLAQLENMHLVADSVVSEARRMKADSMDAGTAAEGEAVTPGAKGRPASAADADETDTEPEDRAGDDAALARAPSAGVDMTGSAAGKRLLSRLAFIGEDNVKNLSAVKNLMSMGKPKNHRYVFFGASSGLETVLPGVKVHVLGPPTIKQSSAVKKMKSRDAEEFWMLRQRFWNSQRLAATGSSGGGGGGARLFKKAKTIDPIPRSSRWFVRRLRGVRAKQLLELVTILDDVMNNTSVILLFEVGGKKLLFPGDAQIENWSFALKDPRNEKKVLPLLAEVDVYKVGHHGSRNATPKTLFDNFKKLDTKESPGRLVSLISTKSGKHGTASSHTEVPRATLVKALKAETDYNTTQTVTASAVERCVLKTIEL